MIRLLLKLYPKAWRQTYGEEFAALLEECHLGPAAVINVVAQAVKFHAIEHSGRALFIAAGFMSVGLELMSRAAGISANLLWSPTTPARALALLALFAPWIALLTRTARCRVRREWVA